MKSQKLSGELGRIGWALIGIVKMDFLHIRALIRQFMGRMHDRASIWHLKKSVKCFEAAHGLYEREEAVIQAYLERMGNREDRI